MCDVNPIMSVFAVATWDARWLGVTQKLDAVEAAVLTAALDSFRKEFLDAAYTTVVAGAPVPVCAELVKPHLVRETLATLFSVWMATEHAAALLKLGFCGRFSRDSLDAMRRSAQLISWDASAFGGSRFNGRIWLSGEQAAARPLLLSMLGITHILCCFKGEKMYKRFNGDIQALGATASSTKNIGTRRAQLTPAISGDPAAVAYDSLLSSLGIVRRLDPMVDDESYDLYPHFDESIAFIEFALKSSQDTKVLVHCSAGAHRSPTIIAAFLIAKVGMSAEDAIESLHKCRKMVDPIPSAVTALKRLQAETFANRR